MQLAGVDPVRLGQLGHGLQRQRHQAEPVGRLAPGELAERDPQRMGAVELVVAVARDDEGGHGRDAAAEQAKDVERRVVGPVHVLEDHDRRQLPGEVTQDGGGHRVRRGAVGHQVGELAAGDRGDVHQRAERGEREEPVALAPQDPSQAGVARAEAAQEHGLADPGLARDEHEPAAGAGRRVEGGVERIEVGGALEQRGLVRRQGHRRRILSRLPG